MCVITKQILTHYYSSGRYAGQKPTGHSVERQLLSLEFVAIVPIVLISVVVRIWEHVWIKICLISSQ